MHYLIDGYNLLFHLQHIEGTFQKRRQKIIEILQKEIYKNKLSALLVFDGTDRKEDESEYYYFGPLEVVFTQKGQTADEFIIETVQFSKRPSQETVITSDKKLSKHCVCYGSHVLSVPNFLALLDKKKKKGNLLQNEEVKDSPKNIKRLIQIFEKRLKEEDFNE